MPTTKSKTKKTPIAKKSPKTTKYNIKIIPSKKKKLDAFEEHFVKSIIKGWNEDEDVQTTVDPNVLNNQLGTWDKDFAEVDIYGNDGNLAEDDYNSTFADKLITDPIDEVIRTYAGLSDDLATPM